MPAGRIFLSYPGTRTPGTFMVWNKYQRSTAKAATIIQRAWRRRKARKAKTVTGKVNMALKIAKRNAQAIDLYHYKEQIPTTSFNNASAFTVLAADTAINMTSAATSSGFAENYSGGKTGLIVIPLGRYNRATTDSTNGYRSGDGVLLKSFWVKMKLSCNATTNANVRVLLVQHRGAIVLPEDTGIYENQASPELETFINKGNKASRIKRVVYDRVVKLDDFDHDGSTKQVKHFNFFRKVNQKTNYYAPTLGSAGTTGDADGYMDVGEFSRAWSILLCTDSSTTSAVTVSGNILTNYNP